MVQLFNKTHTHTHLFFVDIILAFLLGEKVLLYYPVAYMLANNHLNLYTLRKPLFFIC